MHVLVGLSMDVGSKELTHAEKLTTFRNMKHQMIASFAASIAWTCLTLPAWAQDTVFDMPSKEKLELAALEIATAVAQSGTTNDLVLMAEVLPRWPAFYEVFEEQLGRTLEAELAVLRDAWKTEVFCDEWVRNYRRSCAQDDLEFMHLKPVEVIYVKCGGELDAGVPEQVCYSNVRFVDGKGDGGIMRMLTIVDRGQLWLADEVELK